MSSLGLTWRRLRSQQQRPPTNAAAREDQVHVQAPAPGQVLGQHAAEQQADRAAAAGDRAVDAERLAALLRVGERGGQQRQRRGREQRAERALAGAGRDQHGEVDRGAADGRGAGEAEQAGQERPFRPNRSASRPPSSSRLPNARAYAVTIHCRSTW